jgi:hypothetical protein
VDEKGLCNPGEVGVGQDAMTYGGYVEFQGTAASGHTPEEVEAGIAEVIEALQEELVGERELQKAKNQAQAESVRRLSSSFFLLLQMLMYQARDVGWEYINEANGYQQAVTAEDIQRVAKEYLVPTRRSVAIFRTKETETGEGGEPDPLADLPEQMRTRVRMVEGQLTQLEDAERIRGMIGQIEGQIESAEDENQKKAATYLVERLRERLAELEAAGKEDQP